MSLTISQLRKLCKQKKLNSSASRGDMKKYCPAYELGDKIPERMYTVGLLRKVCSRLGVQVKKKAKRGDLLRALARHKKSSQKRAVSSSRTVTDPAYIGLRPAGHSPIRPRMWRQGSRDWSPILCVNGQCEVHMGSKIYRAACARTSSSQNRPRPKALSRAPPLAEQRRGQSPLRRPRSKAQSRSPSKARKSPQRTKSPRKIVIQPASSGRRSPARPSPRRRSPGHIL